MPGKGNQNSEKKSPRLLAEEFRCRFYCMRDLLTLLYALIDMPQFPCTERPLEPKKPKAPKDNLPQTKYIDELNKYNEDVRTYPLRMQQFEANLATYNAELNAKVQEFVAALRDKLMEQNQQSPPYFDRSFNAAPNPASVYSDGSDQAELNVRPGSSKMSQYSPENKYSLNWRNGNCSDSRDFSNSQNAGFSGSQNAGFSGSQNAGFSGSQNGGFSGSQNGGFSGSQNGNYYQLKNEDCPAPHDCSAPYVPATNYNEQAPAVTYQDQQNGNYHEQQNGTYQDQQAPAVTYHDQQNGNYTVQQAPAVTYHDQQTSAVTYQDQQAPAVTYHDQQAPAVTYTNQQNGTYSTQQNGTYSAQQNGTYSTQQNDTYTAQPNGTYSSQQNSTYPVQQNGTYSAQQTPNPTYSNRSSPNPTHSNRSSPNPTYSNQQSPNSIYPAQPAPILTYQAPLQVTTNFTNQSPASQISTPDILFTPPYTPNDATMWRKHSYQKQNGYNCVPERSRSVYSSNSSLNETFPFDESVFRDQWRPNQNFGEWYISNQRKYEQTPEQQTPPISNHEFAVPQLPPSNFAQSLPAQSHSVSPAPQRENRSIRQRIAASGSQQLQEPINRKKKQKCGIVTDEMKDPQYQERQQNPPQPEQRNWNRKLWKKMGSE